MTGGLSEPKTRQSTRHRPHLHFVNKYTIGVTYILPVWRKVADHLKIFVWKVFVIFYACYQIRHVGVYLKGGTALFLDIHHVHVLFVTKMKKL